MPTITVVKSDLQQLLGAEIDLDLLETELELAKGELKGFEAATDELKIELNDTNRPDLWSPAGIARQLRTKRQGSATEYDFLGPGAAKRAIADAPRIIVDPRLEEIRPFVAGFLVSGQALDDTGVRALIQSQEKLAENYGRRRQAVAIGAYRLNLVRFPIHYLAADPHTTRFVPLEFDEPLALTEILDRHPKGQEYGHLIREQEFYPLLTDDDGEVLSMPPIINSRTLGQIVAGDAELFVEVTGHDLRQLLLAINIAAVDFADRGSTVQPVVVEYPYETPFGRQVVSPHDFVQPISLRLSDCNRLLGDTIPPEELRALLSGMGHRDVRLEIDGDAGATLTLTPPPYRDDLLHPVDVIEDVAISRNLNAFEPILPHEFTIGKLSRTEELCRKACEHLIGAGFQEAVTYILTAKEALRERMLLPEDDQLVEVDNVMARTFAVLRDSQIPALLGIEAVSSKAPYPHRVFEIGEAVLAAPEENFGCRTRVLVTAMLAHPKATLSELQSYLEALAYYMGRDYTLQPITHPSFMAGRVGEIRLGDEGVGRIGEIHPESLERWGISMPTSVFELDLVAFADAD